MTKSRKFLLVVLAILISTSTVSGQSFQRVFNDTLYVMKSRTDTTVGYDFNVTFPQNGIWLYEQGFFKIADIDTLSAGGGSIRKIPAFMYLDAIAWLPQGTKPDLDTLTVSGDKREEIFLFDDTLSETLFVKTAFDSTLFSVDSLEIFVSTDSTSNDSIKFSLEKVQIDLGVNPTTAAFDAVRHDTLVNDGTGNLQKLVFKTGLTDISRGETHLFSLSRDPTIGGNQSGDIRFHYALIHGQGAVFIANQSTGVGLSIENNDVSIVPIATTFDFSNKFSVTESPTSEGNIDITDIFLRNDQLDLQTGGVDFDGRIGLINGNIIQFHSGGTGSVFSGFKASSLLSVSNTWILPVSDGIKDGLSLVTDSQDTLSFDVPRFVVKEDDQAPIDTVKVISFDAGSLTVTADTAFVTSGGGGGGDFSDGGDNAVSNRILGNNTNFDLSIETNDITRILIENDGDVVFGTGPPSGAGRVQIHSGSNPTALSLITTDTEARMFLQGAATSSTGIQIIANGEDLEAESNFGDITLRSSDEIFFSTNGISRMNIENNGFVEIGGTVASHPLEVNGGTNDAVLMVRSSDVGVDISLDDSGTDENGTRIRGENHNLFFLATSGSNSSIIEFRSENRIDFRTGSVNSFRIDSNDRAHSANNLNTAPAPAHQFTVHHSTDNIVANFMSEDFTSAIAFEDNNTTANTVFIGADVDTMRFSGRGAVTQRVNNVEVLRLTNGPTQERVGIGKSKPDARLHVTTTLDTILILNGDVIGADSTAFVLRNAEIHGESFNASVNNGEHYLKVSNTNGRTDAIGSSEIWTNDTTNEAYYSHAATDSSAIIDSRIYPGSKSFFWESPTATDSLGAISFTFDVIIDSVHFAIEHDGGTNDTLGVNFKFGTNYKQLGPNGTGTSVFTSAVDATSDSRQTASTGFNDNTIPADNMIRIFTTRIVGTVFNVNAIVYFRKEP